MKVTKIQNAALETVIGLVDTIKKEELLTLIYGILNIELEKDLTDLTTIPINPDNGNDKLQINIPDWVKSVPSPPFVPGDKVIAEPAPWEPRVWYNQKPEPIQTDAHPDVRYVTEVTNTGDKNCIVHTSNTNDVQYNANVEIECEEPIKK